MMDGFLGVFISSTGKSELDWSDNTKYSPVVSKPDIKAMFDKNEWQTTFSIRYAHPYLAVHEQAMVQVHHWIPGGCTGAGLLLAFLRG